MISVLIPSRGRPDLFEESVRAFRDTTAGQLEIVTMLDQDDPRLVDYDRTLADEVIIHDGKKIGSSDIWNQLAESCTGDYMMMANDDHMMLTENWDCQLMADIPADDMFVAWPNGQNGQCVNPIVSRRWYNSIGWFVQPGFRWWWLDTALQDLGARVGRLLYMPKIICEHRSSIFGKRFRDDTDARRMDNVERNRDRQRFFDTIPVRDKLAKTIRRIME